MRPRRGTVLNKQKERRQIMAIVIGIVLFICLLFTGTIINKMKDFLWNRKVKAFDNLNENYINKDKISPEEAFQGFVGNEGAVLQIQRLLRYAEQTGERRLPNLGFFGPKSTGKTELARRIAKAMNIPTLTLSKSTLNSEESFFAEVSKEITEYADGMAIAPPMIIFLDEVHVLSRKIQDSLLTALEGSDRCFRSKAGDIDTRNITFIMATTDPGKLAEAFKSRLTVFWLEPYSVSQIMDMLKLRRVLDDDIDKTAMFLDDNSLEFIARASRAIPRKAIELLRQTAMTISLGDIGTDFEDIKKDLFRTMACDSHGLVEVDRKYLRYLHERKIAGLSLLCSALGMDKENIENGIEPWLVQNQWVERGPRGRQLTQKGSILVENYL